MIKSELEIDVRYYETDQMGIVHHSNYIRYFEFGRSDMMAKAGIPIDKIEAAGVVLPVISVECRYRMPAKMGDRILPYLTFGISAARLRVWGLFSICRPNIWNSLST